VVDGAFSGSFVLHLDEDDGRNLVGFAPGPAGMAVLDLGRGMSLAVDFADPTTLVSCRADGWLRDDVLEVLVGTRAAQRVAQVQQSDRPVRIADHDEMERERMRNSNWNGRPGNPVAMAFGVCAVLSSLTDDEQRHELVRAVAALELAEQSRLLPLPDDVVEDVANRARTRALDLLADGADAFEQLAERDPRTAARVRSLIRSVMADDPGDELRWRRISQEFDRRSRPRPSVRSAPARKSERPYALEPERVPERTVVDLKPNGLMIVHRPAETDDKATWVRVLQGPQLSLLAAAPLIRSGSRQRAELLVPPDLTLEQLVVEMTKDALPVTSTLEQIRRAIDLGRRAATLEALRSPRASDAWQSCAIAWSALGDPRRAQLALDHFGIGRSRSASIAERVESVFDVAS
jgi:hypothetical protein